MKGRVWGGEFDASWTKSGRETGAQGFIFTQGEMRHRVYCHRGGRDQIPARKIYKN